MTRQHAPCLDPTQSRPYGKFRLEGGPVKRSWPGSGWVARAGDDGSHSSVIDGCRAPCGGRSWSQFPREKTKRLEVVERYRKYQVPSVEMVTSSRVPPDWDSGATAPSTKHRSRADALERRSSILTMTGRIRAYDQGSASGRRESAEPDVLRREGEEPRRHAFPMCWVKLWTA